MSLSKTMKLALTGIYENPNPDRFSKRTLQALVNRGLIDSKYELTEAGRVNIMESMSLTKQCNVLSIDLKKTPWIQAGKPELFAYQYYESKGYVGAYCEGGAIGAAIKALCLDALPHNSLAGVTMLKLYVIQR